MARLIDRVYDPETGFTDETWFDESTGKMTLRRLQDVEDTLEHNKAQFLSHEGRTNYKDSKGFHKVASIPLVIIEKWLREDGFDWFNSSDADRRKKLNQPENRFLLTRPGKL